MKVPAGEYAAETWRAVVDQGPSITFFVEQQSPHRILEWRSTSGESAKMIKSTRLKYWEMNRPSGESELQKLGLSRRPSRTP